MRLLEGARCTSLGEYAPWIAVTCRSQRTFTALNQEEASHG